MTGYLEGSCSIQLSYGVKSINKSVGVAGFEPTTSCSQSRRDTGLRYTPKINQALKTGKLPGDDATQVQPFLPLQVTKNAEGGKGPSVPVIRLIGTKVRQRGCPGNFYGVA
jgi:hypothetical protein